jgi:zinc/manganese transport system ATP-binding protein
VAGARVRLPTVIPFRSADRLPDLVPDRASDRQHDPVLRLTDAAAIRGGHIVWEHVTLQVSAGQFVAVLGPNGVGKSTLLQTVLGLTPLSAGTAEVLGRPVGRGNAAVGYLPQRRSFDPATPIRGVDLIGLGLDGDRWGTPLPWPGRRRRERQGRIAAAVDLVGAGAYAERPVGQCSGGEQQRLLIAQALVRRPRLLLLDEPLDSLDVTNQASVSALVRGICHDQGVAVIMVAHDVNPILSALDAVIYLAHGGAVLGPPQEVITSETLTMLYGTPVEVLHDRAGHLVVVGQPDVPAAHQHPGHQHPGHQYPSHQHPGAHDHDSRVGRP